MLILAYIRIRSEQPYDIVNKLRLSCAKLSTALARYSLAISFTVYAKTAYYAPLCLFREGLEKIINLIFEPFPKLSLHEL